MCDEFIGTAGFTVAHHVRARHEMIHAKISCFGVDELIGEYPLTETALANLRRVKCDRNLKFQRSQVFAGCGVPELRRAVDVCWSFFL